jgi:hypothetical protein
MFMLITTVTSLAGCFFNCVLQECILGCPQKQIKKNFWFKPKITETGSVSRLVQFIFETNENFVSVCFGLFRCFECILKN